MLNTLEVARDSIEFPPGQSEPNALGAQIALQRAAEEAQRQQFEQMQAQTRANMEIKQQQPKEPPQFSERDLEFLGSRPGIEKDDYFIRAAQGMSQSLGYGTDRFYRALEAAFPLSDYRRVEPKRENSPPPSIVERSEEPKPQRRIVTSGPVSRNDSGAPSNYAPSPSAVRLSAEERDIAAASGMSEADYARGKLRLQKLKDSGFYNEGGE